MGSGMMPFVEAEIKEKVTRDALNSYNNIQRGSTITTNESLALKSSLMFPGHPGQARVHEVVRTAAKVINEVLLSREKLRKRRSTVRASGRLNNATRLKGTNIFYFDDLLIGRGATANVYEGFHVVANKPAAIKRVRQEDVNVFENELKIWMSVGSTVTADSVNIVQLYEWKRWKEGGCWTAYYFAMELATSDLKRRVTEDFKPSIWNNQEEIRKQLISYLQDAAKGLKWLHDKRIIHRDIKPENILIFAKGPNYPEIAKLGDFGISRKIENISTGTNSRGQGTSDWMSPEAIEAFHREEELHTTPRVDMFSFGLTGHFAISGGVHPFQKSGKHGRFITANIKDLEVQPSSLRAENEAARNEHSADHLFQWMMLKSQTHRPKILQVLNHPFFWDAKTSLKFLIDVARTFDVKRDPEVNELKGRLDEMADHLYEWVESDPGRRFNWASELGSDLYSLLQSRRSSNYVNQYDTNTVTSLLKMIRDKYAHSVDLVADLLEDEYFGVDGQFCEEKYVKLFLQKFPYLEIFLFTVLSKSWKQYSFVNGLKRSYHLTGQSDIPSLSPLKQYFDE